MDKTNLQIRVLANNTSHRGPGKVYQNLTKGLKSLGHGVNQPIIGEPDLNICLQMVPAVHSLDPAKTLFGPNLVVLPTEARELFSDPSRHFLVPSHWVKDLYCQFDFVHPNNLHVWAVGIDLDRWNVSPKQQPSQDCFVYFKNRSEEDLRVVRLLLKKFNLKYSILQYGSYTEDQLRKACSDSRFAVLLTGTESQGIAYMEILSTNTPCYVFNKSTWESEDKAIKQLASSVPYFDDGFCGAISPDQISLEHFKEFLNALDKLCPGYYMGQYSLENSANDLIEISKNIK